MKIDWKHLATTVGYKSLKATYIKAVQDAARQKRPMRDKAEFLRKFQWVISRAKHYASHTSKSIEVVLNEWEEKRTYCWLNFYQDCSQPKFHSNFKKPMGVKGTRKYYKNDSWYKNDPVRIRDRMKSFIAYFNTNKPKKAKPRWSMARKKRGY